MKRQKSILPGALGVRVVKTKQYPKGDINFALRSFKKDLKESGKLQELRETKPNTTKILSNARCLTEGIDLPVLDGIAFIDPNQSQIDIGIQPFTLLKDNETIFIKLLRSILSLERIATM